MPNSNDKEYIATLAKALTAICVRNGEIENLHAGIYPASETGDYSDVKVVTPHGEIPWNEVSRLSDDEMKTLMKDIVNNLYTVLLQEDNAEYMAKLLAHAQRYTQQWDEPEIKPPLMK